MSRKTKRIKRARRNRCRAEFQKNIAKKPPSSRTLRGEKQLHRFRKKQPLIPKPFLETCLEQIQQWLCEGTEIRALLFAFILYGFGTILYASIGNAIGFSFWKIVTFIFVWTIITIAGELLRAECRDALREASVTAPHRSYFMQCNMFFEKITTVVRKHVSVYFTGVKNFWIFYVSAAFVFCLPPVGIGLAAMYILMLAAVFLDVFRLFSILGINLCFRITPNPKNIAWAYVIWSVLGAIIGMFWYYSFFPHERHTDLQLMIHLFAPISLGGMWGIALSFYKESRAMKYRTPYLSFF